jgi:predicted permease
MPWNLWFKRRRWERRMDDEFRFHLHSQISHYVSQGLSRNEAELRARREFGSMDLAKDECRDQRPMEWFDHFLRDVRYACRSLRKSPGFAAAAIVTLALGIGANTAIFSVVNAIMLRPLPVQRPQELVSLTTVYPEDEESVYSYEAYRRFAADGASIVDAIAASSARREGVTWNSVPEPVSYKWVSGNYFDTLGVPAQIGRTLRAADDRLPFGEPVAVVSDAYWTRRFGRAPSVIGRTFRFKAATFTVVGVAPRGFFGETVGEAPDFWIPLTAQLGAPSYLWHGHSTTWLSILARVRSGVTAAQARTRLDAIYDRVRQDVANGTESAQFRKAVLASRLEVSEASGGGSGVRRSLSSPLLLLMGVVALVLVIACANVANLVIARAAARRRLTAVCLAIGAERSRLVRQGLVEALLLAGVGGAGGLLLASLGTSALARSVSEMLPISIDLSPDRSVLGFTMALSCATAVLFGVLPAFRATRIDPIAALKREAAPGTRRRLPLGRTLVVPQITVSTVLLMGAALFVHSLLELKDIDLGFDPNRVLLCQMTLSGDERSASLDEMRSVYRRLIERVEGIGGVEGVSASFVGALSHETWGNVVAAEGFTPSSRAATVTFANAVSAKYFDVMRIPLRRGRSFADADDETAPKVSVINQTFARRFFDQADPLGKWVALCASDPCSSDTQKMMTVVGVAEDAKYADVREAARPMLYVPFTQVNQALHEVQLRTAGSPDAVAPTVLRELAAVDRRVTVVGMVELRDQVDHSLLAERLIAKLSGLFGLLALGLAAVGLYGVIAYVTAERTGEIGIRMALGAASRDVRRLVLRDTVALVVGGVAIGLPLGMACAQLLTGFLYRISPNDPVAIAAALATLSAASLLAGYLPARRATRVDPVIALRAE